MKTAVKLTRTLTHGLALLATVSALASPVAVGQERGERQWRSDARVERGSDERVSRRDSDPDRGRDRDRGGDRDGGRDWGGDRDRDWSRDRDDARHRARDDDDHRHRDRDRKRDDRTWDHYWGGSSYGYGWGDSGWGDTWGYSRSRTSYPHYDGYRDWGFGHYPSYSRRSYTYVNPYAYGDYGGYRSSVRVVYRPVFRDRGVRYTVGGYYPYHTRTVILNDWDSYGLYEPPSGYHWVRDDDGDDIVLAALATGAIIALAALVAD